MHFVERAINKRNGKEWTTARHVLGPPTDFSEGGQPLPAGYCRARAGDAVTLAVDLGQRDHRLSETECGRTVEVWKHVNHCRR